MNNSNKLPRLEARIPPCVYETVRQAAEIKGCSAIAFVVAAAHDAARRVIEEEAINRFLAEDQMRFASALFEPAIGRTRKAPPAMAPAPARQAPLTVLECPVDERIPLPAMPAPAVEMFA